MRYQPGTIAHDVETTTRRLLQIPARAIRTGDLLHRYGQRYAVRKVSKTVIVRRGPKARPIRVRIRRIETDGPLATFAQESTHRARFSIGRNHAVSVWRQTDR